MTELFECNRCGAHVYEEIQLDYRLLGIEQHLCDRCWREVMKRRI